ncbi:MAG TPA: GNAT family N-acetyltransferase [Jiangellaceae bacterium]
MSNLISTRLRTRVSGIAPVAGIPRTWTHARHIRCSDKMGCHFEQVPVSFELDRDMRDDRRAREAPTDAVRIEQREVSEDVAWEWIAVADDQTVGWLGAHVWPDVVRRDRSGTGRRVVLCRMEIHGAWSGTGLNRRLVDALRKWRDERGDIDAYSVGLAHRDLTMLKEAGFYPASGYVPRMLTLSAE